MLNNVLILVLNDFITYWTPYQIISYFGYSSNWVILLQFQKSENHIQVQFNPIWLSNTLTDKWNATNNWIVLLLHNKRYNTELLFVDVISMSRIIMRHLPLLLITKEWRIFWKWPTPDTWPNHFDHHPINIVCNQNQVVIVWDHHELHKNSEWLGNGRLINWFPWIS